MLYPFIFLAMAGAATIATDRSSQRTLFLIAVVPMTLFVATRYSVGCDFWGYARRFELYTDIVQRGLESASLGKSEIGFAFVNFAVIWNELPFVWVNVVCAVILFACLTAFATRREASMSLLALFFPIVIVQLGMSGIRQATATAILLLAFNAFSDRKRLTMAIWIVVASLFHTSALMFLPLVFAIGRELKLWRLVVGTLIVLPFATFLAGDRIDTYADRYGDGDVESFGAIFRSALIVITAVFFEIYRKNFKRLYPEDYALMRVFSIFALGLAVLTVFSSIAAHRVGFYLMPVHLLTLVRLPRAMADGRREPLLEVVPFVAYGLYITVWFATSRHAQQCYLPYESTLF